MKTAAAMNKLISKSIFISIFFFALTFASIHNGYLYIYFSLFVIKCIEIPSYFHLKRRKPSGQKKVHSKQVCFMRLNQFHQDKVK